MYHMLYFLIKYKKVWFSFIVIESQMTRFISYVVNISTVKLIREICLKRISDNVDDTKWFWSMSYYAIIMESSPLFTFQLPFHTDSL